MYLRVSLRRIGRTGYDFHTARSASHVRNIAITRPTPENRPQNFKSLVKSLRAAAYAKNDTADIHASYKALVKARSNQSRTEEDASSATLTADDFVTVIDSLGSSKRPADVSIISGIADDIPTVFGIQFTTRLHDALLRAFVRNGHIQAACNWLQTMARKSGQLKPNREQWHFFLENIENGTLTESFKYLRNIVKVHMPASGCKPNNETYKYLIRARCESLKSSHLHTLVFKTILDDMKGDGLPYDASVAALLHSSCAELGFPRQGVEIVQYYYGSFPDISFSAEEKEQQWHSWLSSIARVNGIKAALKFFRELEKDGCTASPLILKALMRNAKSSKEIIFLEHEFNLPATASHWSILITNLCRSRNTSAAINTYNDAKSAGVTIDAALVGPIISLLCQSTFLPPTDQAIDQALAIYRELAEASPIQAQNTGTQDGETSVLHSHGPDTQIYSTLLRALAVSPNTEHFSKAVALLNDMQSRGISLEDSIVITSTIVLLMRNSRNLDQAFNFYRQLCGGLDAKGYAIVLNAFCKLSFNPQDHVPSLPRYFQIVSDMRHAGHKMTPEVYTILLRQLAIVGTRLQRPDSPLPLEILPRLVTAVRRVHDHITLDASISPDAHLLNQLMDTYQRLGCFGDACRVWEMMYLSGRFDHVGVSIILDACGHAGSWKVAKQVCLQLSRDNFLFNQHNWNTWIECLCRLGMLNEAVKIACLEMGKTQEDVAPDIDTARVLMSFARKSGQQLEVASRIERYLPELWAKLPDDLRTK
ncbi:Pentatricopeptide repeat-containing protein [Pleurotus pulmonarius]|nr:hypothetical protein EYR36_007694 [Pleurotus pulmonarius]